MSETIRPGIGIGDLVYALLTPGSDVISGTPAYGTVKPLAGTAQLTFNPNGQVATDYADNGPAVVVGTTGKLQVGLEMLDVQEAAYAEIFGASRANGVLQEKSLDSPPELALGYKQLLSGAQGGQPVYRYVWLLRGVLSKPQDGGQTKKESISFQHMNISGEFLRLESNGSYRTRCRTDDADLPSATKTAWFNQPVISNGASLTPVTVGAATGSASGHTITIPFAKSGETFALAAPAVQDIKIIVASTGELLAGTTTFTPSAAGVAPTIVCANANIAAVEYIVVVTERVHDVNGVYVAADSQSVTPA